MNKQPVRKILIFIFIIGVLVFIFSNMLKCRKTNDLLKYNEEFMNNYINNNLANCEIKEIKQYVFVPPALGIDGGDYKEVEKDYIDKDYKKEVSVFDKELHMNYVITFSHGKNEGIKINGKSREDYLENYKNYNKNF